MSGAASCVSCHREESRNHEKSRHARTFHHGRGLLELPFPDRPLADPDDPKVTHTFKRENDKIKVDTRAGDKILSGDRRVCLRDQRPVRDDGRSRRGKNLPSAQAVVVSHRGQARPGAVRRATCPDSNSAENIRGEPIRVRDGVVRCLYCHVTFYRDFRDPPPELGRSPGCRGQAIGCERCHGPGGNHLKAIKGEFRGHRHRERRDVGCSGDRQALRRLPHRRAPRARSRVSPRTRDSSARQG